MDYHSAIQRWNDGFCINMEGPRDDHTKWSQRKTNIIWYHLFLEFEKKNDTNELIYETENQKHRK